MCQARWSGLSKFDAKDVAAGLADAIGDEYPFSEQQHEMEVTITPTGVTQKPTGIIHRFQSVDRLWTVTLSDLFLALDTVDYYGHVDFIERLGQAFDALLGVARIPSLARVGYRYTNRLDQPEDILRVKEYFAPSILGGLAHDTPSQVAQTVSETLLKDGGKYLAVRSALLGPNASIDPTLAPVPTQSWLVDLDSYEESAKGLPVNSLRDRAAELSDRASAHFRQLITDAFIVRFR